MTELKTPRSAADLAKVLREAPAGTVADENAEVSFVMLGTSFRDEIVTALEVAAGILPPVPDAFDILDALEKGVMGLLENSAAVVKAFDRESPDPMPFVYRWGDAETRPELAECLPMILVKRPECLPLEDFAYGVDLFALQKTGALSKVAERMSIVSESLHGAHINLPDGRIGKIDRVTADAQSREIADIKIKITVLPF